MKKLTIGQAVINHFNCGDIKATVIGFHEITGDPILQDADGMRWIADPKRTIPDTSDSLPSHRDGLVAIG